MKILGIDTSTSSLSVAVTNGQILQSEYSINHKLTHSEQLMPSIDRMLSSLGYLPKDLDAIGVCIGPGSFTGIRIGVAAANAMAMTLGIPVVGISSLQAMAYSVFRSGQAVFATLDAQRDRLYRAAYTFLDGCEVLLEEDVIEKKQLYEELSVYEEAILLGDAVFMMEDLPPGTQIGRIHERYIRAAEVCYLTAQVLEKGETGGFVRPIYLRKSQAEVQFEEKLRQPERYLLKSMDAQNVEAVHELEKLSFAIPWTLAALKEELGNPKAHYLVLEEESSGKIVAFGGFWQILDEAHICNVAVHPDYRGVGLGDRIVGAMIEKTKELQISEMTLEVRASNEPAKKLYGKYGFKLGGVRKEYYSDNREDALIMWRREE